MTTYLNTSVDTAEHQERTRLAKRHIAARRVRTAAWSAVSIVFAVSVAGFMATRLFM